MPVQPSPAATANPDVGLVLQVQGEVSFTSADGGKSSKMQAFMKIRQGDRLQVPAGGSIKLVYFSAQGRQELWRGPVEVTVEQYQGQGAGPGGAPVQPEVFR